MASNLNVVEYFLNDANRAQKALLEHVVSPEFTFAAPLMHPRNFKSYVSFTGSYSANRKVTIDTISTNDDMNFDVDYTVEFINHITKNSRKEAGSLHIKVRNGLIYLLKFHNQFIHGVNKSYGT